MGTRGGRTTLDVASDLARAVHLGSKPERIDLLLGEALDSLAGVIPYELATIMELDGERHLRMRVWRGPLTGPGLAEMRVDLARFPSLREVLERRQARAFHERDHAEGDGDLFDGVLDLPHGHACMVVPLYVAEDNLGIMSFDRSVCEPYPPPVVTLAAIFGRLLALALTYGEQSQILRRIQTQLEEHNRLLTAQVPGKAAPSEMLDRCQSEIMLRVAQTARRVASSDAPVLICGESGTGKEVLARAIHDWSPRREGPMVSVNCAALPLGLVESELFGHQKGAFSGAERSRPGRFQVANGGTLFLDEIGELPLEVQPKLLRVLQDGTFQPVGGDHAVRVDVRIIAATHVDLAQAVADRRFREDIYYRLNVVPITLPPLRERREDIPVLVIGCLEDLHRRTGQGPWRVRDEDLRRLQAHPWPGNVRELVNVLERATILSPRGEALRFDDASLAAPQTGGRTATQPFPTLEEMERAHFRAALQRTGGKLSGPGGAAGLLGLNPSTARSRLLKLGLK